MTMKPVKAAVTVLGKMSQTLALFYPTPIGRTPLIIYVIHLLYYSDDPISTVSGPVIERRVKIKH